jgi:hypothetical protein
VVPDSTGRLVAIISFDRLRDAKDASAGRLPVVWIGL